MNIIKPTVGRKVWYRPNAQDRQVMAVFSNQPLDATVVCVHSDNCVNLAIFDANGQPHTRCSAYLKQEGVEIPIWATSWAEWMPYQTKDAAREPALDAITAIQHPLKAGIVPIELPDAAPAVTVTASQAGVVVNGEPLEVQHQPV